ncbi:MAG TPA: A/G-specific adenine glycosylase [Mycobacteriales bacterium]
MPTATRPGSASALDPGRLLTWYDEAARDLPWRAPGASPWGVLVSEVMLQQTPVARVLPAWAAWLERWPTPADCASASPADVVRAWGRLGYPRRALRLRECAVACTDRHGGDVPSGPADLAALPGVGAYTAAAVAAFAFGRRVAVVDTNVKRVAMRAGAGVDDSRPVSAADRRAVASLLPAADAPRWSVAVMELGALVCTARRPGCERCPLREDCRWLAAGMPPWAGPSSPPQGYAGTDRQVRGRLLAALREADDPVPAADLALLWDRAEQRERALASLVADGLAVGDPATGYRLPE